MIGKRKPSVRQVPGGSEVQEATSGFWAFELQFLILGLARREGRGSVRTVARGGLIGLGFYG